jgi:hypothetical protein
LGFDGGYQEFVASPYSISRTLRGLFENGRGRQKHI